MGRDHLPGAGMRQGGEWALVVRGERWGRSGDLSSILGGRAQTSQIRALRDEDGKRVLAGRFRTEGFVSDLFDCLNYRMGSRFAELSRAPWRVGRLGVRTPFLAPRAGDDGWGGFG